MSNTSVEKIFKFVSAAFPGVWVQTLEADALCRDLLKAAADLPPKNGNVAMNVMLFDIVTGLVPTQQASPQFVQAFQAESEQPKNPAQQMMANSVPKFVRALQKLQELPTTSVTLVLVRNAHMQAILGNELCLQATCNFFPYGKVSNVCLVFLSSGYQIPKEIERQVAIVTHDLPNRDELKAVVGDVIGADELRDMPTDVLEVALTALTGLTSEEAENAVALSLVYKDTLDAGVIWDFKLQMLKKTGYLTVHTGVTNFNDIGGCDNFKEIATNICKIRRHDDLVKPKGMLLLGLPGTGKTMAAKALGNATGRKLLELNLGTIRSKYQGETDHNLAQLFRFVDMMQPCILYVDELDKALSGVSTESQQAGGGDSGTGDRILGGLLTWLSEHESDVVFVGSCNSVKGFPASLTRAERFDAKFYFNLPDEADREKIWKLYLHKYAIAADEAKIKRLATLAHDWTGAEIKSCCRLSLLYGKEVDSMRQLIRPVGSASAVDTSWVRDNCLPASNGYMITLDCAQQLTAATGREPASMADYRRRVSQLNSGGRQGEQTHVSGSDPTKPTSSTKTAKAGAATNVAKPKAVGKQAREAD